MKHKLLASVIIGVFAALIDIAPGLLRGVDLYITLAGFTFWLMMGPLIAFIALPMQDWSKGMIVASLLAVPGVIMISAVQPESVIPMILLTLALGSAVGFLTGRYAR